MKFNVTVLTAGLIAASLGVAETGTLTSFNPVTGGPPAQSQWRQTFYDEFQGGRIDQNKWQVSDENCETLEKKFGDKTPFVLSLRKRPQPNESKDTSNIYVKEGFLHLVNRRLSTSCTYPYLQYSGGLIQAAQLKNPAPTDPTEAKTEPFLQTYGYFEARIKYANHPRINNAFWMVGSRREIDINEGWAPHLVRTNFHTHIPGAVHPGANVPRHFEYENIDFANSWHVFGLEWNPHQIVYYLDGNPIRVLSYSVDGREVINLPTGTKLGVLLSTAVMNLNDAELRPFVNNPEEEAAFRKKEYAGVEGTKMMVDWVKVWQKVEPTNPPSEFFAASSNVHEIEAEDFAVKIAGKGGFKHFAWEKGADASDGCTYMAVPPSETPISTRDKAVGPELTYFVRFNSPGRYAVNVQMRGLSKNTDSIHFGREGEPVTFKEKQGPPTFGMQDSFRDGDWHSIGIVSGRRTADGVNREQVIVHIPYAGLHEFNLWMREPGVAVDKFSFTPVE